MKTHKAIAPLSRDHHTSLILVQLLKKNASIYSVLHGNDKAKALYAQEQFAAHIKKHFHQEEEMLEKVKDCHPDINILVSQIKEEHRLLTWLFKKLRSASNLAEAIDTLANSMEKQIRMEERILFPILQRHCSKKILKEIHELLH